MQKTVGGQCPPTVIRSAQPARPPALVSEDQEQDDDDDQDQGHDGDGASVHVVPFLHAPGGGLGRSLAQAARSASGHAVTTKIARTNDGADQVDYAGLVTSRDLDRKPGAPSVQRSIMVVRSTHKVTRSTEIQTGECENGDSGNSVWGGGERPCGTPSRRRHTTCRTTCRARAAGTPFTPTWCAATSAAASLPRCRVTPPDAAYPDQGWSSTLTERRSSIAR